MASFVPRTVFPTLDSLPRSYFLGHHRAGLTKMKTMLNYIDLVIECRDYRVPITSRNPLFEENLAGRERLIVYTKQDLGSEGRQRDRIVCTLQDMHIGEVIVKANFYRENGSSKNGNSPARSFSPTIGTRALCVKSSTSLETVLQQETP